MGNSLISLVSELLHGKFHFSEPTINLFTSYHLKKKLILKKKVSRCFKWKFSLISHGFHRMPEPINGRQQMERQQPVVVAWLRGAPRKSRRLWKSHGFLWPFMGPMFNE
jgi:hypothetical protein